MLKCSNPEPHYYASVGNFRNHEFTFVVVRTLCHFAQSSFNICVIEHYTFFIFL